MAFYHVLLTIVDNTDSFRCILSDLSEENLRKQFLQPYRRGNSILCGDEVVESLKIKRLKIIRTLEGSEPALKKLQEESFRRIQEFNRNSNGIAIISPGRGFNLEDVADIGEDVTTQYVSTAPGEGDAWKTVISFLNNGWVVGVGVGLIVAALLWWLGWD